MRSGADAAGVDGAGAIAEAAICVGARTTGVDGAGATADMATLYSGIGGSGVVGAAQGVCTAITSGIDGKGVLGAGMPMFVPATGVPGMAAPPPTAAAEAALLAAAAAPESAEAATTEPSTAMAVPAAGMAAEVNPRAGAETTVPSVEQPPGRRSIRVAKMAKTTTKQAMITKGRADSTKVSSFAMPSAKVSNIAWVSCLMASVRRPMASPILLLESSAAARALLVSPRGKACCKSLLS
mmetsp:Transcript_7536/g.19104  ORF Transcript_7536/g.19104 Transcript_7536/m.19104 type:complete len:239 (+) Transcript_7536:554-1270(+)